MGSLLGTKDPQNETITDEVSVPFIADQHVQRTKAVAASSSKFLFASLDEENSRRDIAFTMCKRSFCCRFTGGMLNECGTLTRSFFPTKGNCSKFPAWDIAIP